MSSTTAYATAPFDISYAARTPLISSAEYLASAQSLDLNNLIRGSAQANATVLVEAIGRASSWCDQFCFGAYGCIAATSQVEDCRTWGTYRGTLSVRTRMWPILEVDSFAYTPIPGGLANGTNAASITPAGNITIYPQSFEVASYGNSVAWTGINGSTGIVKGIEYDTVFSYVAGWPQTTLGASVAAGATSIQPSVVTGIYPNSLMTIYDVPNDEPITVSSSYVPGSSVVPLTSELQYTHSTGATVTNLPPAIKQAAVWATNAFIKQRGSGALEVTDMGAAVHQASGAPQNSGSDMHQAMMLLHAFKQQYVGY